MKLDLKKLTDDEIFDLITKLKNERLRRADIIHTVFLTGTHYQFKDKNNNVVYEYQYRDNIDHHGGSFCYDEFDKLKFADELEVNCHADAIAINYESAIIQLVKKGYILSHVNDFVLFFKRKTK